MKKLKIGVFFDGTGNNAYNTKKDIPESEKYFTKSTNKLNEYETDDQITNDSFLKQLNEEFKLPRTYSSTERSSNDSDYTNIWYLYQSYKTGSVNADTHQIKVYVEGVGTRKGHDDDYVTIALAWSPFFFLHKTGCLNKVNDAIKQIREELKSYFKKYPSLVFDDIEFYIFGFSRGATTARHFSNMIKKKNKDIIHLFKEISKHYTSISQKPTGSIEMLGIFDSVAAVLALSQGSFNVHDSKTGSIDITLNKDIANYIFHITAGHEIRYNFSLNGTSPNYNHELKFPGVHADIGGSYRDKTDEHFFLSQPLYSEVHESIKNEDTDSFKKTKEKFDELMKHPHWGKILSLCAIEIKSWQKKMSGPFVLYGNAIFIKRYNIRTGINVIAFQTMRYYANKIGLAFSSLEDTEYSSIERIPDNLKKLNENAKLQVDKMFKGETVESLIDNITAELGNKYIHSSHFWDENPSKYIASQHSFLDTITLNLLLSNRPTDDNIRTEFDSYGKTLVE
ncbi:MAG: T6SS phospholipase effector Tle1-like catalytic domain-containing protein [Candidatus Arsenophonus phytopathogenicus]